MTYQYVVFAFVVCEWLTRVELVLVVVVTARQNPKNETFGSWTSGHCDNINDYYITTVSLITEQRNAWAGRPSTQTNRWVYVPRVLVHRKFLDRLVIFLRTKNITTTDHPPFMERWRWSSHCQTTVLSGDGRERTETLDSGTCNVMLHKSSCSQTLAMQPWHLQRDKKMLCLEKTYWGLLPSPGLSAVKSIDPLPSAMSQTQNVPDLSLQLTISSAITDKRSQATAMATKEICCSSILLSSSSKQKYRFHAPANASFISCR